MRSTFLALGIATATALNIFAPAVGYAQDYVVNGHSASKAEAQFLASYSAPAGQWQFDGYGISRVCSATIWMGSRIASFRNVAGITSVASS